MKHVLYLHGFASSPSTQKVTYFRGKLAGKATLHAPDMNVPSFARLSIAAMIGQAQATIDALDDADDVTIIGSSMSAVPAVEVAKRETRVSRLVLISPTLDFFAARGGDSFHDSLADWRETGERPFFHHAYKEVINVNYALAEELAAFTLEKIDIGVPTLIFHSLAEMNTDYKISLAVANKFPQVRIIVFDDDHTMNNSLDKMWPHVARLLDVT